MINKCGSDNTVALMFDKIFGYCQCPNDEITTDLVFQLSEYSNELCIEHDKNFLRLCFYQSALELYVQNLIQKGIKTDEEKVLEGYYVKYKQVWSKGSKKLAAFLKKDACNIRCELLKDLILIRDIQIQEPRIGALNVFFLYLIQMMDMPVCTKHSSCLEFAFNFNLIAGIFNGDIDINEAKLRIERWKIASLNDDLMKKSRHMRPPVFHIEGEFVPGKKKLIYLDTNVFIDIEEKRFDNGAENSCDWHLIMESKNYFDYYYSPAHLEDIQKRKGELFSKRRFIDLLNEVTDHIEIHRVNGGVRFDYEDAHYCNKRVDNSDSLELTKVLEEIRLNKIKVINDLYPEFSSQYHRNEINNKDLFGEDRKLLEQALKYVGASFNLADVKDIYTPQIPYDKINDIVYSFIRAFDVLHYQSERNRDGGKIKSATHDTEHIIYAAYSDYFVTGDIRLFSRAHGILGWIAPNVGILKGKVFSDWIEKQIGLNSGFNSS